MRHHNGADAPTALDPRWGLIYRLSELEKRKASIAWRKTTSSELFYRKSAGCSARCRVSIERSLGRSFVGRASQTTAAVRIARSLETPMPTPVVTAQLSAPAQDEVGRAALVVVRRGPVPFHPLRVARIVATDQERFVMWTTSSSQSQEVGKRARYCHKERPCRYSKRSKYTSCRTHSISTALTDCDQDEICRPTRDVGQI